MRECLQNDIAFFHTVCISCCVSTYWLNSQLGSGSRLNAGGLRRSLRVRRATSLTRVRRSSLACRSLPHFPPCSRTSSELSDPAFRQLPSSQLHSHRLHVCLTTSVPSHLLSSASQTPLSQRARLTTPLRIHPLLTPRRGPGTAGINISARPLSPETRRLQGIYPASPVSSDRQRDGDRQRLPCRS